MQLEERLSILRQKKPLVLALTNNVTVNFVANSLLSVGAAPVMSESIEDIADLIKIANSVYINVGTLNDNFIERAISTCLLAKHYNIPIVIDPVGAGASKIRTKTAISLLNHASVVRGNASEILALADQETSTFGVESIHQVEEVTIIAKKLATKHGCTLIVSGRKDYISNGIEENFIDFGSEIMSQVTGMGCSLTAIIAAFVAINPNFYQASFDAINFFTIVGQITDRLSKGTGSFQSAFLDNLYKPNWQEINKLYE